VKRIAQIKRWGRWLTPVLAAAFLVCIPACKQKETESPGQWVTILHTNDIHGHYRATPASWVDGNPPVGGFPAASFFVSRERGDAERSLLLDAGDFMTGNPICDLDYNGVRGGGMPAFFNLLGYDALCLGNHDFDHKWEVTRGLIGLTEMPVLCANVFKPSGDLFSDKGYEIYNLDGVRVGVIGLVMDGLSGYLRSGALGDLFVEAGLVSVERILDEVDRKTDLIILLTHIGVETDEAVAERLSGRVDVIVGGHSHTRITEPEQTSGVVIVQAGGNNRYLGRLDVFVQGDRVADFRGHLIPMWVSEAKPNPEVEALAVQFDQQIDDLYGAVIADITVDGFGSSRAESNIGNWIADRLREAAKADVAVINSGGIRKHLPKGPVKALDIKEMLPFDNQLMVFMCTGEELLTMAATNARALANQAGGLLQVSGIRYRWRRGPAGDVVIESAEVGGRPVKKERIYRVASPDYSVTHSDRYFGFEPKNVESLYVAVSKVIMDAAREAGIIDPKVDGRMAEIGAE